MTNYALIIGIDRHPSNVEVPPRPQAAHAARRMATWLVEQGWVAHDHVLLLCGSQDLIDGALPATRDEIIRAMQVLRTISHGSEEQSRLYFFYAGYGIGFSSEQLLLLPKDSQADALSDMSLRWSDLLLWMRATDFTTQFCFLDICRIDDAHLADGLMRESPFPDTAEAAASTNNTQYVFYATSDAESVDAKQTRSTFSDVLYEGLTGSTAISIDYEREMRVVRFEALQAFVEREVAARSQERVRCLAFGQPSDDPIMARLGPAARGKLDVFIVPPEAAQVARISIYHDQVLDPVAISIGAPCSFDLLQDERYRITAHATGYKDADSYSTLGTATQALRLVLQKRVMGGGVLGDSHRTLIELCLQPQARQLPLPIQLFDGRGNQIKLPPRKPRGIVLKTPPDQYRAVLVTPQRNVEQIFETDPKQTALTIELPFAEPDTILDRVLSLVDDGHNLAIRLPPNQGALILLASDSHLSLVANPVRQGTLQPTQSIDFLAQLNNLVQGSYVGTPGLIQVQIEMMAGRVYHLLLPLLAGRVTIVALETGVSDMPLIEVLFAPLHLRRRLVDGQRRILWAQRFFRQERRAFVPPLVHALRDEPLALVLAGYAALSIRDISQASQYALQLRMVTPTLSDGHILLAVTEQEQGRTLLNPELPMLVPSLLTGIQHQFDLVHNQRISTSIAPALLRHAVFTQMWPLLRDIDDIETFFSTNIHPLALRDAIARAFSREELATLCFDLTQRLHAAGFDLRISIDDIDVVNVLARAQNLVELMDRYGHLEMLVAAIRQARPGLL